MESSPRQIPTNQYTPTQVLGKNVVVCYFESIEIFDVEAAESPGVELQRMTGWG